MSNVLKFTNKDRVKPFPDAVDEFFRSLDVPQSVCEEAVAWVAEVSQTYKIPDFTLSINFPDGLTPEQHGHLRHEIGREFARYGAAIDSVKAFYIVSTLKKRLGLG